MISKKTKYSIRVILYLSIHAEQSNPMSGIAVAKALQTPLAFTMKILQGLVKLNLISSFKGPGGGFYLSEKNRSQTLLKVLEQLNDMSFFDECALGLSTCNSKKPCPIHEMVKKSRIILYELFYSKRIQDITQEIINEHSYLVN